MNKKRLVCAWMRCVVPARIYKLSNITRNENLAATLVCQSHGDPAPVMKFRKIGNLHDFNASNVSHSLAHFVTHVIHPLSTTRLTVTLKHNMLDRPST